MQRLALSSIFRIVAEKFPGRLFFTSRTGCSSFLSTIVTSSRKTSTDVLSYPPRNFCTVQCCKRTCSNAASQVTKESTNPDEEHTTQTILQRLHILEESLRVRGYSVLRWGLAVILVTGIAIYVFREPLRENMADEVADVASRSLADENVVNKANEVTRVVLQDILNDPESIKLASSFLMSVLQRDDVKTTAIDLTLHVLKDPATLDSVHQLATKVVSHLIQSEGTRTLTLAYLKALILDEVTRDACKTLVQSICSDQGVKDFVAETFGEVVASSVVTNKAIELGKNVTHEVVNDANLQQETGNAMWGAFKQSVTPGWFGGS